MSETSERIPPAPYPQPKCPQCRGFIEDLTESQLWAKQRVETLESTLAAREVEIDRLKLDDPQFDATDYAHPAWWRGHDNATAVICQKVHEILDGKDDGQGGNHEPWGATRRRLIEVASQLAAATKRIGELEHALRIANHCGAAWDQAEAAVYGTTPPGAEGSEESFSQGTT